MKRLDAYFVREQVGPFLLALSGFCLMMLADSLFYTAEIIVDRGAPAMVIIKWLLLRLPAVLVLAFPVSTLFSTLFALGRMSRDNEILALRTGRNSFYRLMLPFVFVGVAASALAYLTNEKIVPWTNHASENIFRRLILSQSLPQIQENILFKGGADLHFYIRRYYPIPKMAEGVYVYEASPGKFPRTMAAQKAFLEGSVWELQDGVVHHYGEDGSLDYEAKFKSMKLHLDINLIDFFGNQKTPQEMDAKELLQQITMFKKGGVDVKRLATDYYFKFSIPVACLVVALLASPLSLLFGKGGIIFGVILSIVLTFVYYVVMSLGRSFGFIGVLPPWFAAWLPDVLFGGAAVFLIWKVEH